VSSHRSLVDSALLRLWTLRATSSPVSKTSGFIGDRLGSQVGSRSWRRVRPTPRSVRALSWGAVVGCDGVCDRGMPRWMLHVGVALLMRLTKQLMSLPRVGEYDICLC
ncbi:unnamed protein product, partial [Ectocarpus fasciculatus]